MGDLEDKYHVKIDGNGYILGRNRKGIKYYQKKRAPLFVSKFGSGDSSYRDATFWQFFAQTNWRNGSQQLKFDDPGKFWKSENIDTTQLEKITLSKKFVSAGQLEAGAKVTFIDSWRADPSASIFGDGSDGALTISTDTTEAPVDSACTGTKGSTSLTATNASFAVGDKILIHQTVGVGAGNKQETSIAAYTAGTITTSDPLEYDFVSGAQVRTVLQYSSVTVDATKTLTAKAWDGTVGGILAFKCNGITTISGDISANGKGSRGGGSPSNDDGYCGDGSGGTTAKQRTANGSGGGGGINDNAGYGGGGGGHAAAGTNGGSGAHADNYGLGGEEVGAAALTELFMGGGGGSGATTVVPTGTNGDGGAGGGIIYGATKTLTVTGGIEASGANGVSGGSDNSVGGGGGGAGGSILFKVQTATLGEGLILAAAGSGGAAGANGTAGGAGAVGRIHLDYANSYTGTSTPDLDASQDGTLVDTPPSSKSTAYAGTDTGKIFSWDDGVTWTEEYDVRNLTLYDTIANVDAHAIIGDDGGTEKAASQGFQLATAAKVKGIRVYLKKNAGTPGDITVRIEDDDASNRPDGNLADAAATATIPAFATTDYGWVTVEFDEAFSLAASTQYHLVLKTAAGDADNNYAWGYNSSSNGYASGDLSTSADGGSSWTAVPDDDCMFKILSNASGANCSLVTKVGGTKKLYVGAGDPAGVENGEAKLISFDGTDWALAKTFNTATESCVLALTEYTADDSVYISVGPQAKIYSTDDFSTYTLSENIDKPRNPGYPYVLMEYNRSMYAMGGSPELVPNQYYSGFIYYYDSTEWGNLYPFDFTVIKSASFYDAYLFIGTYHGHLFVFDTASLNPIFNFKDLFEYQVSIDDMLFYDDMLFLALRPQDNSNETNVGVWRYDRHGLTNAYHDESLGGYYSIGQVNNEMLVGADNGYVYKVDPDNYASTGWVQSSYFDANLPSINKLWNEVEIRHDPLPANTTIEVLYKEKEADDWTSLGTSSTDDAESATFSFAAGVNSKKISLKYILTTTDSTVTPTVTDVILKYALWPETKWQWNMKIMAKENLNLRDRTTSTDDAAAIRDNIEASKEGNELITFTDIDGTDYTVLFQDIDQSTWTVDEDNLGEDMISVSLIEA